MSQGQYLRMMVGLFAGIGAQTETAVAASAITSNDFLKANGKTLRNNYGNGSVVQLKGTLDWFVNEAGRRGMYVVIDFHGAPGSQNGSDHSGIDGGNDKLGASQFFFGNNAYNNQQIYYDMWYKIAQHFAGNPTVAGYDLLNEPYCTYRYNSGYSADYLHDMLWNIYNNAYNVIRSADPDHVIIMEATWDPVDLPNPSQYGWNNVMYEYHNYQYSDYDNANGEQISNMQRKVDAIKAANYNVPSYMGEFCYFNNLSAWDQGLALLTNAGINWTSWTYKCISDYGNWGLYNQTNLAANIETDSWDTLCNKYSRVGESWANTGLINTMKNYFNRGAVSADGSSTSGSSSSNAVAATIANGDYYFKASNGSTEYVPCAENTGNDPLIANRASYGGAWEQISIVNNSDGTVSLKSGANNKYVCADFNNGGTLRAISDSVAGSWEAFTFHKL